MKNGSQDILHRILRVLDIFATRKGIWMCQVELTEDGFTAWVMGDKGQWYRAEVVLAAEPVDAPESMEFYMPEPRPEEDADEVEHVAVDWTPPGRNRSVSICQGCSGRTPGKIVLALSCEVLGSAEEET